MMAAIFYGPGKCHTIEDVEIDQPKGNEVLVRTVASTSNRAVVRFYNKRGTAEQWIKKAKQAVAMTRLSCHRFQGNQVRLWLSVIAYNLGNLWRRLALPREIGSWSLTSLQQRLVKTGGRLIKHARYTGCCSRKVT